MKGKLVFDAKKFDLWECCGMFLSKGFSACPKCGKPRLDGGDSRRGDSEPERSEQKALVDKGALAEALPESSGRFDITIERHGPGTLDDDNLCGGSKQLRDAIAELLGKRGDGKSDGLEFHYLQVKSRFKKMVIKIKAVD